MSMQEGLGKRIERRRACSRPRGVREGSWTVSMFSSERLCQPSAWRTQCRIGGMLVEGKSSGSRDVWVLLMRLGDWESLSLLSLVLAVPGLLMYRSLKYPVVKYPTRLTMAQSSSPIAPSPTRQASELGLRSILDSIHRTKILTKLVSK